MPVDFKRSNNKSPCFVSFLNLACLDVYWGLFIFTKVIRLIGIRQIYFVPTFWNFRYNEQGS